MLILTLRTDKPEAEIGLFDDDQQLLYQTWQAHRQLAETIHLKIQAILKEAGKNLSEIEGIVIYQGPGSFTGLRIGLSVANALADSLQVAIVGSTEKTWLGTGRARLIQNENDGIVTPYYGADPNITPQKK